MGSGWAFNGFVQYLWAGDSRYFLTQFLHKINTFDLRETISHYLSVSFGSTALVWINWLLYAHVKTYGHLKGSDVYQINAMRRLKPYSSTINEVGVFYFVYI